MSELWRTLSSWSCLSAYLVLVSLPVRPGCTCLCLWVLHERKGASIRCNHIVAVVSEVTHCCKLSDTCYIAPLQTRLDEGKWSFNRLDSHFDWELCPKASTLPASKASQRFLPRLILTSRCCPFGLFSFCLYIYFFHFFCNALSFDVHVPMASWDRYPCIVCIASTFSSIAFDCFLLLREVMLTRPWLQRSSMMFVCSHCQLPSSFNLVWFFKRLCGMHFLSLADLHELDKRTLISVSCQ